MFFAFCVFKVLTCLKTKFVFKPTIYNPLKPLGCFNLKNVRNSEQYGSLEGDKHHFLILILVQPQLSWQKWQYFSKLQILLEQSVRWSNIILLINVNTLVESKKAKNGQKWVSTTSKVMVVNFANKNQGRLDKNLTNFY